MTDDVNNAGPDREQLIKNLSRSKKAIPFHVAFTGMAVMATALWPFWLTYVALGVAGFSLFGDIVNVLYTRSRLNGSEHG